MNAVLAFLRTCLQHPKTTSMGIGSIASGVALLVHARDNFNNIALGAGLILGGLGSVFATDAPPSEQMPPPQPK